MRGGRAHRPPHIRSRTCCLRSTSLTVAVTGEGRATHLGDSDLSATVTIVLATGSGTSTDTTITGASGDEDEGNLFLTTVTSETPPSPQGIIILSGTYTITGGTGEFRVLRVQEPSLGRSPSPPVQFPRASAGPYPCEHNLSASQAWSRGIPITHSRLALIVASPTPC